MCHMFIPDYAYRENHISCYNCGNTASSFMVDSFISSNYAQAVALSNMKINQIESEKTVDAKGNVQILSKTVGCYTPWFAENSSQVPMLIPICRECRDDIEYTNSIINNLMKFISDINEINYQEENIRYIHCHHGFKLFKLQKERFNSGSPYYPWINKDLLESTYDKSI